MNEQQVLKQFAQQISMEFNVRSVTIYKDNDKIYGNAIDSTSLEKYLSITCTTVFRDHDKSCLVSHIQIGNTLYIIILFSDCKTAFDGLDSQYIVGEIKKLKKKLGDKE